MAAPIAKSIVPLIRPVIPYLRYLPQPLLTLPPVLALHLTAHPAPSLTSFFLDPLTHPLHAPLLFTLGLMPFIYPLGLLTGNVSWVDRSWPIYPVICSGMVFAWGCLNSGAGVYGHNLSRLACMLFLQVVWSIRLSRHAIRRSVYDLTTEDYRYTAFRKLVPGWAFQLVHLFAISIAQPILLFSLCLPLHSALITPPNELSSGPIGALSVPFSAVERFLPSRLHSASPSTPVLNLVDLCLVLAGLAIITIEAKADNAMFKYQTAKHASKSADIVQPPKPAKSGSRTPQPAAYPREYHPGFIVSGMYKWSRHPNFMAEQLFWVNQALFVVGAGESSGVTRSKWVFSSVFGPCFALSVLFTASTFLTEWITGRKYPAYSSYKKLVGQFLPQETALIWLWGTITGSRSRAKKEVYS